MKKANGPKLKRGKFELILVGLEKKVYRRDEEVILSVLLVLSLWPCSVRKWDRHIFPGAQRSGCS